MAENPNSPSELANAVADVDPEFAALLQEVFGASARAGVIVAAAAVEDTLRRAISERLFKKDPPTLGALFKGASAPLGSFSAKIHLGYALGVFLEPTKQDLMTIKDVRNLFAHDFTIRGFDHPQVKKYCEKLNYPHFVGSEVARAALSDARLGFLATANHLYFGLRIGSGNSMLPNNIPRINNYLLDYGYRPGAPVSSRKKVRVRTSNRKPAPGHASQGTDTPPQS